MTGVIWIVATVLVLFSVGYVAYGRYLSRFVELDDSRETPAHKYQDGQEYVPAKKPVLLGHHFSSIAGGAPIAGPITAALIWGWLPAVLWVAIGNPLMGAVHDFMSLSSSVRHEGKSIGYIIGEYIGERGKNMFLWFAFLVIILVVAVFSLLVAIILDAYPQAATASIIYIALAFVFGVWLYQLNLPFIAGTGVFVAGVFASVWVGLQFPIALFEPSGFADEAIILLGGDGAWVPGSGLFGANTAMWIIVALVYAFLAAILPVWVLLQPRDYLSSFLLYTGVGGTLLAVIVGTFLGTAQAPDGTTGAEALTIQLPAYTGFFGGDLVDVAMPLFPLLFITIACGTISGFHSLVSSGTTAKQLNRESDARMIGYGGMLGEGLLAATALAAVSVIAVTDAGVGGIGAALPNFAEGGGLILTSFGIPMLTGEVFMALVFVSFLLTSLDTGLRLGRYMMEELVGTPETDVENVAANKYVNTGVATVAAFLLVSSGQWEELWPLFGGANQLLAALALLTATVWLANWKDTKQLLTTGVPVVIMAVITVCGLLWLAFVENLQRQLLDPAWRAEFGAIGVISSGLRMLLAFVLIFLALSIIKMAYDNLSEARESLISPEEPAVGSDDD
ncbi:carbon starvation CstA family protein [Natrarchaeobaculum aegyptiacum]|uniref:Carbon starvation protein A n=1 Tax=Natrarchaeobaculum aegyptiacum TaxID=745377 RepID=A0A2Z2HU00_9EURY|nr:carbon starvation protein A [Natrarchaeobaculum aegyptiacum]ARS90711.1 carbon starvation protein A [Natrarchaeobaculum aegyptiacum]